MDHVEAKLRICAANNTDEALMKRTCLEGAEEIKRLRGLLFRATQLLGCNEDAASDAIELIAEIKAVLSNGNN